MHNMLRLFLYRILRVNLQAKPLFNKLKVGKVNVFSLSMI